MFKKILSLIVMLLPCAMAGAQVVPAARGGSLGNGLRVGAELSGFAPDFSNQHLYGAAVYGDYDIKKWVGIEGNFRFLQFNKFQGKLTEDTYAGGLRFIYNKNRYAPFAKAMYGLGQINFPAPGGFPKYTYDSYPYYSFGGGLDYKINRRISARVEYEQQWWNNTFVQKGTLTPSGFSIGASYRIF